MQPHHTQITQTFTAATAGTYFTIGEVLGGPGAVEAQLASPAPTGTPTTPTLDMTIESSLDNANWTTLLTFTQQTTSAANERKTAVEGASSHIGRYFRVKTVVTLASGTVAYVPVLSITWRTMQ